MKNLFAILSFVLSFSLSGYASNILPTLDEDLIIVDNVEVSFTIKKESSHIVTTSFHEGEDIFTIETENTINFLQVVNENGEIEYQLPIGSNLLKLTLSDFDKGVFQLNLLVEGENQFVSTELIKKI